MKEFDIVIIGGGPAGLMAAIAASEDTDLSVGILEKTDSLGKKLLLTGGGRCNITNGKPIKKLLNLYDDKNFLKHSFYSLTNEKLLNYFESKNLEFKELDDNRIFPTTDKASSVLNILKEYLNDYNVKTILNYNVSQIIKKDDYFLINNEIKGSKVIITTGGITYPQTGSSGDGYTLASSFNHSISDIKYGLAPLYCDNLEELSGVVLYNVAVTYNNFTLEGDVLITHFGFSGPIISNISNEISKDLDYNLINSRDVQIENTKIFIDFLPNLNFNDINDKFIKDSSVKGKVKLKNYLKVFLTNSFIDFFLDKISVDGEVSLSNLSKKDKNLIINSLKSLEFEIKGFESKASKATVGGVKIDEINSKTMESKIINGLYFSGEILEPIGLTGGYNLKIAFSTGYLAGKSASNSLN